MAQRISDSVLKICETESVIVGSRLDKVTCPFSNLGIGNEAAMSKLL